MKSWKTFLIGLAGAVFIAVQPVFTKEGFDIAKDWKYLVAAGLVAAFGYVAKDANVTGGTVSNGLKPTPPNNVVEPGTKDTPATNGDAK